MFIDIFDKLCKQHRVSKTKVITDLKMSKSNVTRWSEGREPSGSTKLLIAQYFGVPMSELDEKTDNIGTYEETDLTAEEQDFILRFRQASDKDKMLIRVVLGNGVPTQNEAAG